MFGNNGQDEDIASVNPTLNSDDASTPASDAAAAAASAADPAPVVEPAANPTTTAPAAPEAVVAETPATPAEEPAAPAVEETPVPAVETPTEEPATPAVPSADDAELLALKKQALEELSPLVDQLDQTPEEKFKTTMMMIQATDSANLIKTAHDAALNIADEKVRAQALLDVVNEINYFTQPKE